MGQMDEFTASSLIAQLAASDVVYSFNLFTTLSV